MVQPFRGVRRSGKPVQPCPAQTGAGFHAGAGLRGPDPGLGCRRSSIVCRNACRTISVTSCATLSMSRLPSITRKRSGKLIRQRQKARAHLLLQIEAEILEPFFGTLSPFGAGQAGFRVHVDQQSQVGFAPDHQAVQLVHHTAQIRHATGPDTCECCRQSGRRSPLCPSARAGSMVRSRWSRRAAVNSNISVSADQRSGSPSRTRLRISSAPGDPPGSRVRTTLRPMAAQMFGKHSCLRGLSRSVNAFEGQKQPGFRHNASNGLPITSVSTIPPTVIMRTTNPPVANAFCRPPEVAGFPAGLRV